MALAHALGMRTPRDFFAVARRRQTYRNLLYLLIAFPLGCFYLIIILSGFGLISGIPLILVLIPFWRRLGAFERELAIWWLHCDIPPFFKPRVAGQSWWERFTASLRDMMTWKALLFLFLKFPLGLASLVVVVVLVGGALDLIGALVIYIIGGATGGAIHSYTVITLAAAMLLGVVVLFLALHIVNGVAWLSGQLARVLLGMSEAEQRVAEAQAQTRAAQTRAAQADQRRRALIVNVSHELRTPIASIRGHVESLLMAEGGAGNAPVDQQAYLRIVAREAERLGTLVDDLLALARADADELRLNLAPTDAGGVVEEAFSALAPLAKRERQVTLVRTIPPDLPPVWADRARLGQVVLNLVRNAITYTPTGGIVALALAQPDAAHLAISVADTGIGIPPEELPHIFERFYRTDASRTRATGGSGLGLAIVHDLVSAMGGAIHVASQVDRGSTFTVTLQVAGPAHFAAMVSPAPAPGSRDA
jgi:two-component system phosphate regulon sensor histidine kinase PhoR